MTEEDKEAMKHRMFPAMKLLLHVKKLELEAMHMVLEMTKWDEEDTEVMVNTQMDRLHKIKQAFTSTAIQPYVSDIEDVLYDLSGDILLGRERQGFHVRHHHRRRREQE